MKNKILIPLLLLTALAAFFSFRYAAGTHRATEDKRKLVLETVVAAAQHDHFSPRPIDDTFSSRVYTKLLEFFDNGKIYFNNQDIKLFSTYQYKIDDEIKAGSIEFFDTLDAVFQRRVNETEKLYTKILEKPFSFTGNERLELDNKKDTYADGPKEQEEKWRLELKYRALEKFVDLKDARDKKKVDSPKVAAKTDDSLEVEAREFVRKTEQRIFKSLHKWKDDDRFTFYVNQIAETEDPHTQYFPPAGKKDFDVMMSGSFFGIGAKLKENLESGKITITEIITGSPSWKQGELKADDEILKVAQGAKTPVDIAGYEIGDVVALIRGEKGNRHLTAHEVVKFAYAKGFVM